MTVKPEPPLNIERLQCIVQGATVLNDINASIQEGDVIGLLGKNGAGKTTLLETVLGFGLPAFGQIRLWGEPAHHLSAHLKHRIGYVPQVDELLPLLNGEGHFALYRSLRPRWNQSLVDKLCSEWGIPLQRQTRKMSLGERQKLSIVLALAHEPDLLILDEPVASLDPLARRQFIQQLVDIAADGSRTVVLSSHIVSDIERIASRIWLLSKGGLVWQQSQDELKESVVQVNWRQEDRPQPKLEGVLRREQSGQQVRWVCRDWSEEKHQFLQAQVGVPVHVEYLSLEEIFLSLSESVS